MSFIEGVRARRQKLADVLNDEEYSGIRGIVEELYPDRAHFIYELLQNAEDVGASKVAFKLYRDRLLFEHDGRSFSEDDVWGITNIGKGTKQDDSDTIGRFGVGFKAVFAYTETPRIWSPTYAFEIDGLVLPSELPARPDLGETTRFEFPFNNPKKSMSDAYDEVEAGLNDLSETTLLFLRNIQSISWSIYKKASGEVLCNQLSEYHVEVRKKVDGKEAASSHYLRFIKPVEGLKKQYIGIAFNLDALPKSDDNLNTPLSSQYRIVPANPGKVAVFFPAEKEVSGLRFHLHAPFVPELSRASIKETHANEPLFQQLASLAASSLIIIRDMGLLTAEFLGVLPNPQDAVPRRYHCIRLAIIDAMNNQPLTPTYSKSHKPAQHLLQAKTSLKALLSAKDLEYLIHNGFPRDWAVGAAQKNSDVDRFLSALAIVRWDIEQFVNVLESGLESGRHFDNIVKRVVEGPDEAFISWLSTKTDEWHQKLYSLLYDAMEGQEYKSMHLPWKLKSLCIVRLRNGEYRKGDACFFPTDDSVSDTLLLQVAKAVYASGKQKVEQENAKKFLEAIGVREVGETEQIEAILKQRYLKENFNPEITEIARFIALVEREPERSTLFKNYHLFLRVDHLWAMPSQVYLDLPYLDTGLAMYYKALGESAERAALSDSYIKLGISTERIIKFAQAVGVETGLTIRTASCLQNPQVNYLVYSAPGTTNYNRIDVDYTIQGLDKVLGNPSEPLSRLVWQALVNTKHPDWTARFRRNASQDIRTAPSQLAVLLSSTKWIPQKGGNFVRPVDAVSSLLPDGFPFDSGWAWIKAIHFGEEASKVAEEYHRKQVMARYSGFPDAESMDRAKRFAALPLEEQERFLAECERQKSSGLPDRESKNPERRSTLVSKEASEAPERATEMCSRSVSIGREAVKKETDPYLRQQYTNDEGEMICQVCKTALPFKLAGGEYYYEAVELLPELKKRHYQNYIALCPNHAAMFQHANGSRESIKKMSLELTDNYLKVILAEEDATIYFTKIHITDLKAVIIADQHVSENHEESEDKENVQ